MPRTPENASVVTRDVSQIVENAKKNAEGDTVIEKDPNLSQDPQADPKAAADLANSDAADTGTPADPADKDGDSEDVPATLDLTEPAADPKPEVTVEETGYAEIDAVGNILAEKGVEEAQVILEEFLETGEVSLANKAKMIEALGEGVASMVLKQLDDTANALVNEAQKSTSESLDYANTLFNGADPKTTWKQIQDYVKTPEAGFSAEDRAQMNLMLEQGGLAAKLVFDKIHQVYTADKNVSVQGRLLEGDAASNAATFEPISRMAYSQEMGKAVSTYGEDSPQVRELNRRRQLTMANGG